MSRVCQFKCTQGRKNVRKLGWVGRDDVDVNHVFFFQITKYHSFKQASASERGKNMPNG